MTLLGVIKYLVIVVFLILGTVSKDEQRGRFFIGLGCIVTASIWLFQRGAGA